MTPALDPQLHAIGSTDAVGDIRGPGRLRGGQRGIGAVFGEAPGFSHPDMVA